MAGLCVSVARAHCFTERSLCRATPRGAQRMSRGRTSRPSFLFFLLSPALEVSRSPSRESARRRRRWPDSLCVSASARLSVSLSVARRAREFCSRAGKTKKRNAKCRDAPRQHTRSAGRRGDGGERGVRWVGGWVGQCPAKEFSRFSPLGVGSLLPSPV